MAQHTTIEPQRNTILRPIFEHGEDRTTLDAFARHDARIRATLDDSVRRLGRKEICGRMEKITGRTISIHMLNAWLAPGSSRALFPAVYVKAFCEATGCDALKRLILGPRLSELLELGERAAAILDERARRRVLNVPSDGFSASEKRNGNGPSSCAR
jgi:hypothetical protein